MTSNYRVFIEWMFDIGRNDLIDLYFAYHTEFDLMYFIKDKQLIDDIVEYINSKKYLYDMNNDKYYLVLLILYTN